MTTQRTPAKQKARELAKYLRSERPDYPYLKQLFGELRAVLEISVPRPSQRLPDVPSDEEIRRYYEVVWRARNFQDMVLVKTLLYTGVRVSELVNMRLTDVDVERCQIRINQGKGGKDRLVPFPNTFKEVMAMHIDRMHEKQAGYVFETNRKDKYTDRGVRKYWPAMRQPPG